jgi:uncharacterized protein (DUF1330 family)
MTVYAIAQGRIEDQAQFSQYLARSGATLEAYGVRLLALDEAPIVVEGEADYPRTVILQFDSEAHFRRWYDSPEYRDARRYRDCAAVGRFLLVKGLA